MLFTGITAVGIVLCLRRARLASLVLLGAAIAGALLTPFTFALPGFFLLNAAAIVFFGRREIPTKLVKPAKEQQAAAVEPDAEPEIAPEPEIVPEPEPDPPQAAAPAAS